MDFLAKFSLSVGILIFIASVVLARLAARFFRRTFGEKMSPETKCVRNFSIFCIVFWGAVIPYNFFSKKLLAMAGVPPLFSQLSFQVVNPIVDFLTQIIYVGMWMSCVTALLLVNRTLKQKHIPETEEKG